MSRRSQIFFISFFFFCIFSVGIVQSVKELSEGESIQMLDIFEDTFVQPLKQQNIISRQFSVLDSHIVLAIEELTQVQDVQKDNPDLYDLELEIENAKFAIVDMKKAAQEINRHIKADTISKEFELFKQLYSEIDSLFNLVISGASIQTIEQKLTFVQNLARQKSKNYPQRTWTSVPVLAFNAFFRHTFFRQKYLRAWEAEMEETSIAANTFRPPMQFIRYALMQDLGEKGVPGSDGWMFYKPGIEYLTRPFIRDKRSIIVDPNDKPLVDNPIQTIVTFNKQLDSLNVDLLVVIVPGKGTIYPDQLNRSYYKADDAGRFPHSLRVIDSLRSYGIACVDLFTPFREARMKDSIAGDPLYLSKDTHWKSRGLRLASKLVAEKVKQYPWFNENIHTVDYALDSVTVDREGDVGTMTNLPDFAIRDLQLRFPLEPTLCYQVYSVRKNGAGEEISRRLYRDDYRNTKIILIGDSFSRIYQTDPPRSAGWISHLAYELQHPLGTFVSDGGASTLVRRQLSNAQKKKNILRGKKLVIWEFVERDLRFGAEGWQHVEL